MPGTTTAPSLCAVPGKASTVTPEIRPEPSTLNTTTRAQPSASSAFSAKNSMGAPTSSGHERLSRVNCIYNNGSPKTTVSTGRRGLKLDRLWINARIATMDVTGQPYGAIGNDAGSGAVGCIGGRIAFVGPDADISG